MNNANSKNIIGADKLGPDFMKILEDMGFKVIGCGTHDAFGDFFVDYSNGEMDVRLSSDRGIVDYDVSLSFPIRHLA